MAELQTNSSGTSVHLRPMKIQPMTDTSDDVTSVYILKEGIYPFLMLSLTRLLLAVSNYFSLLI